MFQELIWTRLSPTWQFHFISTYYSNKWIDSLTSIWMKASENWLNLVLLHIIYSSLKQISQFVRQIIKPPTFVCVPAMQQAKHGYFLSLETFNWTLPTANTIITDCTTRVFRKILRTWIRNLLNPLMVLLLQYSYLFISQELLCVKLMNGVHFFEIRCVVGAIVKWIKRAYILRT